LDVFSRGYLRKSELLAAAEERFGLQVSVEGAEVSGSPTGMKSFYASVNTAASQILGYAPAWRSIDAVVEQMELALRA
ncbi:MAG: hypothetical protein JHC85_13885, partial [Chthoniobacterales bacterium]|nr:hypothetical protein [Chthoniobacterales bacterium]